MEGLDGLTGIANRRKFDEGRFYDGITLLIVQKAFNKDFINF